MNRSDIPAVIHQAKKLNQLLEQYGQPLLAATKDWQSPLRSGGAAGCKNEASDPTGVTAAGNLDGQGDPLALVHDEYRKLLQAKQIVDGQLAAIAGHRRLADLLRSKRYADEALAAFVYRHKPVDPNMVDRSRPNLVPACIVCSGPAIPVRRGMCDACRKAFDRADHSDLERFKRERQREAIAASAVVHEHEQEAV